MKLVISKNSSSTEPMLVGVNSEVVVTENAQAILLENADEHSELKIRLEKNACVYFYSVQSCAQTKINFELYENSELHYFNCSISQNNELRSQSFSNSIQVQLLEQHAACSLYGVSYLQHDGVKASHHIEVQHQAPHTQSLMFYKTILDKKTQFGFKGKVYVHPKAFKINSQQMNKNIILSKTAEISTKPELEIYADDVKCTHGAAIGELDQEALFFLQSRGIDKLTATKILLRGFMDEIIEKIHHQSIANKVKQVLCYD